jgi:hypothetical protein
VTDSWWQSAPLAPPNDPGFTGYIPGTPKAPPVPTNYEPDPSSPGRVRPIGGGPDDPSANDTLDDKTVQFYAQQILAGSPMPAMGMGKTASLMRKKVMDEVARQAGAEGLSGADLAKQIAHYQSGKKQLGTLETQLGTTRQNEETALLNGQQFIDRSTELPGQTEYPALNSITQFFQKNTPVPGHETKVAMDAAWNTFVNEYAKVVAGSPSGAGVLSDSARREAQAVLKGNYSLSQKKAVFDQMKVDMENRMVAMKGGINEGYDALVRQPGYEVPDSTTGLTVAPHKQQDHIFIPGVSDGGGPGGGSGGDGGPPGAGQLNDDQKHAYAAFIAANGGKPNSGQVKTFLEKLTGNQINNADEIAAALAKGQGASTNTLNISEQQKIRDRIAQEDKLGVGENPAETLAVQGATLNLSDEAAGVGEAAANIVNSPFTGNFDPVSAYKFGRDVERTRVGDARQQLGWGGTGIELLSGMASAGPANALAAFSPRGAAVAGGVGGALAGFGSGEGPEQSVAGAAGGGVLGAAVGRYAPAVMDRASGLLPRRLRAPQGMAPDVANAARAEGVDLIRPMVDPSSVSDFGALESNVYSQPTIRGATSRVRGQIEDRVENLGEGGTPLETEAAGGVIQRGARAFIQRSKGIASRLYARADRLAGGERIVPGRAIDQAQIELAQLRANSNTNAGEISFVEGLLDDLSQPGGKRVSDLRDLRTSIRGRVNEQGLTATQAQARANRILDEATRDLGALPVGAATAFRRADTFYRERMVHIDDILDRFLGGNVDRGQAKLSGEQAFQRLKAMTSPGGDSRRLGGLLRDLDPNERQDVAATIAQSLGRRAPDEPFSTALFLSQSRKLSPSARRTIFGPDGAQSIDNLRLLSQRLETAEKDVNRSRSATVLERQGIRTAARAFIAGIAGIGSQAVTGSVSGGIAGMAVAGGAMGTSAARRVLSARAMVNPRVSMWLADAADVQTRQQAQDMTRRLGVIIAREPALAHELQGVYQMLEQRLAMPLAAEPKGEGDQNDQQ